MVETLPTIGPDATSSATEDSPPPLLVNTASEALASTAVRAEKREAQQLGGEAKLSLLVDDMTASTGNPEHHAHTL